MGKGLWARPVRVKGGGAEDVGRSSGELSIPDTRRLAAPQQLARCAKSEPPHCKNGRRAPSPQRPMWALHEMIAPFLAAARTTAILGVGPFPYTPNRDTLQESGWQAELRSLSEQRKDEPCSTFATRSNRQCSSRCQAATFSRRRAAATRWTPSHVRVR